MSGERVWLRCLELVGSFWGVGEQKQGLEGREIGGSLAVALI